MELRGRIGVQVAAIRKAAATPRIPRAQDLVETGDILLLVGDPSSLKACKNTLSHNAVS